jgi:hypothetical protein
MCPAPTSADHSGDGTHIASYRTTDAAGNAETAMSVTIKIDTTGPTTAGKATSGRKGRSITLQHWISDNLRLQVTAVKPVVKTSRGRKAKSLSPGTKKTAPWSKVKWKPKARGTYRDYVYRKDLAGNAQRKVGSAKVVVRQRLSRQDDCGVGEGSPRPFCSPIRRRGGVALGSRRPQGTRRLGDFARTERPVNHMIPGAASHSEALTRPA